MDLCYVESWVQKFSNQKILTSSGISIKYNPSFVDTSISYFFKLYLSCATETQLYVGFVTCTDWTVTKSPFGASELAIESTGKSCRQRQEALPKTKPQNSRSVKKSPKPKRCVFTFFSSQYHFTLHYLTYATQLWLYTVYNRYID